MVVGAVVVGTVVVAGRVLVVDAGGGGKEDAVRARVSFEHPDRLARATSVVPITSGHSVLGFTGIVAMSASASSRRSPLPYALLASVLFAVAACGSSTASRSAAPKDSSGNLPTTASTSAPSTSTTTSTTIPPTTTAPAANPPAFAYTVGTVTAADVPSTWRSGCPLPPSQLRMIHLTYWGFDSAPHTGAIVVNAVVVSDVVAIFRALYQERFPIFEMVPQDAYEGNDNTAAAADDTSGFNCRYAVTNPPSQSWSVHAFGEAIDVNDVQNPYVNGSTIIPPAGAAYLNRSEVRPGMAVPGGQLVAAFASVGWQWGGRWSPGTDYQHFSKTGG